MMGEDSLPLCLAEKVVEGSHTLGVVSNGGIV